MPILSALAALSLLLPAPSPTVSAPDIRLKLATLSAEGSVWDKAFRRMGEEWKRDTAGRVELRLYAGGVAGDEPDIVRKMRIGQLHAGALSISGLGEIEPSFKVFEIPLFFESHEELWYVLREMTPLLTERLEAQGYVLLSFGHAGWVRLFSKEPVRVPADLKRQKQFVWSGATQNMVQWWKENGFQPVPLAATDIPTGLQTGLIEAVPAPPIQANQLQWFRSTPWMMDLGAAPYVGATIVTKKAWAEVSAADREVVLAAARRFEAFLLEEVPRQEQAAIAEMQKRGLGVTQPAELAAWRALADDFGRRARTGSLPEDVFDRARELRDLFRARAGSSTD